MEDRRLIRKARENQKLLALEPNNEARVCKTAELFSRAGFHDEAIHTIESYLSSHEDEWLEYRLATMYYRAERFLIAMDIVNNLKKDGITTVAIRELESELLLKIRNEKEKTFNFDGVLVKRESIKERYGMSFLFE